MPTCTVAIPVFNQAGFVVHAVRSALEQDVAELEIVVVDNCSSDGTWEALQPLEREGVRLFRNAANVGLFGNFNRCLELASAPYLRLLSADDLLPPRCLGQEIALMEGHPEVAMLSTRGRFVDPSGAPLGDFATDFPAGIYEGEKIAAQWLAYYAHYRRNPLNYPSGVLFRTACMRGRISFDERFTTTGDIEFYFRVLEHGQLAITDTIGCYVTRHASQAHVGPNLDGTAIREHLQLLDEFSGRLERSVDSRRLRKQFGGICLGLALYRFVTRSTRPSARLHFVLARLIAMGWFNAGSALLRIAACRLIHTVLGHRAPFIPHPALSL